MSWHTGPLLSFDVETTGVDIDTDRIVTACVAHIDGSDVVSTTWLLNPGIEIPDEATEVHGITTEQARTDGEDPAEVLPVIAEHLVDAWHAGVPVIAMNASFDLSLLDRELARHGLPSLEVRLAGFPMLVVDPLVIDRALDRYRKGKKRLEDLCQVYGVVNDAAHDAAGDALAAARVAWKQAVKWPGALAKPLAELTADQARWHRDWAAEFELYLRKVKEDETITIEREWPLRLAEVAS